MRCDQPFPQPRGGQTALAGRSPSRLKAQVCVDHTRSVCETSPAQKAMPPVILNVGLPSTKAPPGASVQPKGSLNFVAARTRKVSGRETSGKKGQFSEVSKGVIQNDICEFESSHPRQPVRSQTAIFPQTALRRFEKFPKTTVEPVGRVLQFGRRYPRSQREAAFLAASMRHAPP